MRPLKAQTQAKVLYGEPEGPLEGAQKAKFKRALAIQNRKQRNVDPDHKAAAVHDDRLYVGWSDGLGVMLEGRSHRREVMRQKSEALGKRIRECG